MLHLEPISSLPEYSVPKFRIFAFKIDSSFCCTISKIGFLKLSYAGTVDAILREPMQVGTGNKSFLTKKIADKSFALSCSTRSLWELVYGFQNRLFAKPFRRESAPLLFQAMSCLRCLRKRADLTSTLILSRDSDLVCTHRGRPLPKMRGAFALN